MRELPFCPVHGFAHTPAMCRTEKVMHPVVCKSRPKLADIGPLKYGTHTLPFEFWTTGAQPGRRPGRKAA